MESIKQDNKNYKFDTLSFNNIFQFCPEGVVYKNKDFKYIHLNDNYCKILSIYDTDSVIGSTQNTFLPIETMNLIHDADTEVKTNHCPINYVLTLNKKLLNIVTFPIINNQDFIGLISVIRDITQEEELKEKFVNKHFKYVDNEKSLQAQRDNFIASVGHDLKNPTLAQIRSLELLLNGSFGKFTPEQSEILEMILDSCRYMNGMLSSLLATYRNYGGAIKLNFENFSFIELVQECVSEMVYVAKDKGVNILLSSTNDRFDIKADKVQIKRVIMNLLSNGIKYAFKNTDLILSIFDKNDQIIFQFENKSKFIPREKQKNIFNKYVSYADMHHELGTGLGLYASNKIIECHRGEMFVESFEENKNIFGFKIPIEQNNNNNSKIIF